MQARRVLAGGPAQFFKLSIIIKTEGFVKDFAGDRGQKKPPRVRGLVVSWRNQEAEGQPAHPPPEGQEGAALELP